MMNWMSSPSVRAAAVGAAAAVAVALTSLIGGWVSGSYQAASDAKRLQLTMVLEIIKLEPPQRPLAAAELLRSGLLKDSDGSICRAFLSNPDADCPIGPAKKSN